jgi:DNA polymerase IV
MTPPGAAAATGFICRDCLWIADTAAPVSRCKRCGSPRGLVHPERDTLAIAHIDCDAFFAAVEKREDPSLADKPVIIGGGRRGVVSTACYVARIHGVRSAMPMFKALEACPNAVVIRPRMALYAEVGRQVREMMRALTPLVEPLSIDEAFLDLTGTERLHGASPALTLLRFAARVEKEVGITVSVGLSYNKFLAKVASDLDKPRGFSVIGKAETQEFLRDRSVRLIWGVGEVGQAALDAAGIRSFADLLRWERRDLHARFGQTGERLWHLARGEDHRRVSAHEPVKGISNETTFHEDTADPDILDGHIWRLSEKVADRAKAKEIAGRVVQLKLKRANHSLLTRRIALRDPTQIADRIYRAARGLFDQVGNAGPYRLLGVGLSELHPESDADPSGDLLDPNTARRAGAEREVGRVRAKFGPDAIVKGRALR